MTRGETLVQGNAGRLHVLEDVPQIERPGLPILFVHGFACDASFWSEQLHHVAAGGRRALALDLRGHGKSAEPADGDYTIASLAADVASVADALGLRRFVLVAHSMGAAVAGYYAGDHIDRVAGLLLVDPPRGNPPPPGGYIQPHPPALAPDSHPGAGAEEPPSAP